MQVALNLIPTTMNGHKGAYLYCQYLEVETERPEVQGHPALQIPGCPVLYETLSHKGNKIC